MSSTTASITPVRIEVAAGPGHEPRLLHKDGEFVLGRGSECAISLDDDRISRNHARFTLKGDRLTIRDLDSSHGVWVNGVRIEPEEDVDLHDRDLVGVAPWSLIIRFADGEDDRAHTVTEPKPESTAPEPAAREGSSSDPYRTHPSIFLRLRADGTLDRQLGWEEFHRIYGPVIAGFARNAGLKPQEVDDVLQDVMLGFFRVADRFSYDPSKGRFRGYLKRVTLNAIRSRRRRKRPQQNLPEDLDPPESINDLETVWEREWTEHLLRRALEEVRATVQPKTMKAFELYGIQGMPAEQVAAETGMTEAAIRHAKMRVLDQLRECIKRLRADEG